MSGAKTRFKKNTVPNCIVGLDMGLDWYFLLTPLQLNSLLSLEAWRTFSLKLWAEELGVGFSFLSGGPIPIAGVLHFLKRGNVEGWYQVFLSFSPSPSLQAAEIGIGGRNHWAKCQAWKEDLCLLLPMNSGNATGKKISGPHRFQDDGTGLVGERGKPINHGFYLYQEPKGKKEEILLTSGVCKNPSHGGPVS